VPTIGRTSEIEYFLSSLISQTYKNFEVIIIDQNKNSHLVPIIEKYNDKLEIIYIKSSVPGLSVNRNRGIKLSNGKILCFPDDDCSYPPNILGDVAFFFTNNPDFQIYSCCVKDSKKNKRFPMATTDSLLNQYNFFNKTISIGIFIKPKSVTDVSFDERLGAGSQFGSAEESDLISKLLCINYKGKYFANKYVYHEYPSLIPNLNRYYTYALGYGAFIKKEIITRKKYRFIFPFLFNLAGRMLFAIIPWKKRKFIWMSLKGQIQGFLKY
jgi:glycosyltransferase involved in cell wall biosynthesis